MESLRSLLLWSKTFTHAQAPRPIKDPFYLMCSNFWMFLLKRKKKGNSVKLKCPFKDVHTLKNSGVSVKSHCFIYLKTQILSCLSYIYNNLNTEGIQPIFPSPSYKRSIFYIVKVKKGIFSSVSSFQTPSQKSMEEKQELPFNFYCLSISRMFAP